MFDIEELKRIFAGMTGRPGRVFYCPGRVNLIGEHIDYNGGSVLPAALSIGIYGVIAPRDDELITLRSAEVGPEVTLDLTQPLVYRESDGWANNPKGVIADLLQQRKAIRGQDIFFTSTLPLGSGLSSSAAMEVLTAYMVLQQQPGALDKVALARDCQRVENQFLGVQCGIMDQFSVALGKRDHCILLNCTTLDYRYIPFPLQQHRLVILNTRKPRGLTDSKYNERRHECERALTLIRKKRPLQNLCEATLHDLEIAIEDPLLFRRARHVVTENIRVQLAVRALQRGNWEEFGSLMKESHRSLKDDYEVTGEALDVIVEEALKHRSCIGARMTGAGFGGCAIALVQQDSIEQFMERVSHSYEERTGIEGAFYVTTFEDGVKELNEERPS